MSLSIIDDHAYSDEGAVIAHAAIPNDFPIVGWLAKESIKRACKARGYAHYKIESLHSDGVFVLCAIETPARH